MTVLASSKAEIWCVINKLCNNAGKVKYLHIGVPSHNNVENLRFLDAAV